MMDNALTSIDDASIISADFSIISRQTVERMHSDDNRALEPEIKPHDLLTDIERSCADLKSLLLASAQDTNTVSKENETFENNGSCSTSIRSTVEPPGDPVQRKQTQIMAQLWKTNEQLVKQLVVEKAKNVERSTVEPPGDPVQRKQTQIMAQLWKTNEQLVKQLVVEKAKNVELDKEKSNLLDRVMELESVVHRLGDNVASRPPNDGGMDLWSVPESIKPAVDTTTTTTATAQKGQTTEFGSLVNELLEKWHGLELDSKAIIDNAKEQADLDQANEEGYVDLAMNSSMQDLICYTVLELKRCKDAMEELKQKMQKTVIMDNKATPFSIRYNGATKCFVNGRNKLWFIEGLLAYHSQPLAAMFTNEYNGVEMVPLPKDEFQGMEHILKIWIPSPTLTVPVDMEHVFSILPIALKYKMIDVMTSCANVLCDTVVEEFDITKAIIDLLKVGAECHLENIVKKCRVWLQENLTIARIEDTLKIATELTLFDLVKKCEERLIASIGDSDFDMSLKGLCLGIRFNLPELISHSFPLCIWRKDVEELLKSKFTIPKLVDQFLTNAISCMTVPWNVDWRFIFSITNLTNTKTGCIPSIGNGCYSCLNDYNGQNRCHTCSHYFCEKCFCKHSMRKCLQFNCKKRYSRNNGSGDVVLDSECLCCGNYYRENDQDDHMKKCMKLRDAVIESLGKNNLRF